jgi:Domain of unknown function (DUF4190)/Protein of unknown function (DUF2510)
VTEALGAWRSDPFGRHEYRYWDGNAWTEHVADQGRIGTDAPDPLGSVLPPPPVLTAAAPSGFQNAPVVYVTQPRNNGLAIAAMVLGIVWVYWIGSLLALIFGYVALSQIKKSQGSQRGRGMAIAGVVLGYVGLALLALVIVLVALNADSISRSLSCDSDYSTLTHAEERFYAGHGTYGTEADLVAVGEISGYSKRHDIRVLGAGRDYEIVDTGDCS